MRTLVLFDIDGTLVRRAGRHHRRSLEAAVGCVTGMSATTDGIPLAGMLDRDILMLMMQAAGLGQQEARAFLPAVMERAQMTYALVCPDLRRRVCPGVRGLLPRLVRCGAVTGLVTGNLSRIGWTKMERAGLRHYFRFGAFAEMGQTRSELAKVAQRRASWHGWHEGRGTAYLIGDHPNDIIAAKASRMKSIAVATGLSSLRELRQYGPDLLLNNLRELEPEMIS